MGKRRAHSRTDPRTGRKVQVREHVVTRKDGSTTRYYDTTTTNRVAKQAAQRPALTDPSSGIDYHTQLPMFVYGTLRPGQGNYSWSLRGRTRTETTGTLQGATMWTNGSYPYVAETDNNSTPVTGTVVDVDKQHWTETVNSIDQLEGFTPGAQINHYVRTVRPIRFPNGETRNCWVYLASDTPQELDQRFPRVTGGDWLDPGEVEARDAHRRAVEARYENSLRTRWWENPETESEPESETDASCVDCGTPGEWLCETCQRAYQ